MPRGANFSREELDSFLDSVEDILPLSTTQWESVVETHLARYPDKGRTVDSLKRKFKELHIKGFLQETLIVRLLSVVQNN